MCDNRIHIPFHGLLKHTQKAILTLFSDLIATAKQAVHSQTWQEETRIAAEGVLKGLGKGLGHLCIGSVSLYGEVTDVLGAAPTFYDA